MPQKPDRHDRPEQHGLDVEQLSPESRHVGPLAQKPLLHDRPAQHGVDALHEAFGFRTDYEIVTHKQMKAIMKKTKMK